MNADGVPFGQMVAAAVGQEGVAEWFRDFDAAEPDEQRRMVQAVSRLGDAA